MKWFEMRAIKDFTKWTLVDLKTVEHIRHVDSETAKQENFIMRIRISDSAAYFFVSLFVCSLWCTHCDWEKTKKSVQKMIVKMKRKTSTKTKKKIRNNRIWQMEMNLCVWALQSSIIFSYQYWTHISICAWICVSLNLF